MRRKAATLFLCVLTLVLIAISPFVLTSYFSEPQQPAAFKGILSLWHIEGWRTGGSSAYAFLQRRISEFEKNHPHVFIEAQRMNVSEANEAIGSGELPDIVSLPSGCEINVTFYPLSAQSGAYIGTAGGALPYMCGAYYAIVNTEIMNENALDVPDGWGIRPDAFLEAAALGIAFCAEPGYSSLPSLAVHAYPDLEGPNISTWGPPPLPDAALGISPMQTSDALASFCSGDVCVLVASQRALFEVETAYEQGESPSFASYALGGYTDMVQYIGVTETSDTLRRDMCAAFAEHITGASAQKKLTALAVFPILRGLEIYEEDDCRMQAYDLLVTQTAYAPPRNADIYSDLALRAFAGDKRALRQLRKALRRPG